ncbi:MAG: fluoride efflux transporter CrcB [Paludibacteraceae bacterium]|nr:fluoride efflux transporter CrcB [Paludibacteraceae bacterium]MBP5742870.1 fluoride efflux transporter CrcB [Paludibacteraceae bacterium]
MIKEILLAGCGSFVGGSLRYVISKALQTATALNFPLGTMAVNIIGCLIIGILSGTAANSGMMSPGTRLLLTTGFCGGFTTFSTFINEGNMMMKEEQFGYMALYIAGSVLLGFLAVIAGNHISKLL